ncbi:MAG: hypothetical protein BGP06_08025 [Rhizobiales bacterium 65-9]|nr:formate dehydrogenase subunit delta [Hyphomicrobiales bacterium]OJY33811.1 MAG: hypothetical protein BGP06_08025 [Rhizobiales bacterium 65-9]
MSGGGENAEKLTRMANQIAAFFKSYPEATAVEGVREHVAKFWTRGMRAAIVAEARRPDNGLDPAVVKAVALLKESQPA